MNKTKFLEGLKEALQGELSSAEINSQLLYYERYIDEELRKGRSEEDIFGELGAPRLIARTIIETKGNRTSYDNDYYEEEEKQVNQKSKNKSQFELHMNGVLALIIGIALILLVIAAIFSLVSALAPILIPILVIILIISFFQKKR